MNQGFTKFQGMIVIHSELRINSLRIHTHMPAGIQHSRASRNAAQGGNKSLSE